jgi:MFS family permease
MAECKQCGKALNKEAGEIGSWCIDCIKEMSDTNTGNMEAKRDSVKKEKIIILVFSAIGAVGGIIGGIIMGGSYGIAAEMIGTIIGMTWALGGLGAGLGYFISGFAFGFKNARAEGRDFGDALKSVLLMGFFFLVLGIFGGVIFFLILVLRRNKWIKKFNTIINSENTAIAELQGYTLGKEINIADLSRKVSIIAENFELAHDGVSLNDLKQLRIVQ